MKPSTIQSSRPPAAEIAISGFAWFVVAVITLYFLRPGYDLISSFEGNYVPGSYEFLVASTFFGLGLGSLALLIALHQASSRSTGSWPGLVFLGLWSVGILIAGIFPANAGDSTLPHLTTVLIAGIFPVETQAYPETTYSFIHTLAILGSFFSLSLAAILLSWRSRPEDKRRFIGYLSLVLALMMAAASILLFLEIFFFFHTEFAGFSLNLLIYTGLTWLFLTALRLRFVVVEPVSS